MVRYVTSSAQELSAPIERSGVIAGESLIQTVHGEQRFVANDGAQLIAEQGRQGAGEDHRGLGSERLLGPDPRDQTVDEGREAVDRAGLQSLDGVLGNYRPRPDQLDPA